MKPFALLLILATPALAQHQTLTLNPQASQVSLTLNTTHEVVHGTFHLQSGTIEFDRTSPKMAGSVVVLAASGQTGNGSRDKRMNKEILLVQQHTAIAFEPRSYTGNLAPSGDSTLQVTGIFRLLDNPHEITIPMLVHIDGPTATTKAHFTIPYIQWGLKDPSLLIWRADKEVTIDLALTGQLSK